MSESYPNFKFTLKLDSRNFQEYKYRSSDRIGSYVGSLSARGSDLHGVMIKNGSKLRRIHKRTRGKFTICLSDYDKNTVSRDILRKKVFL